MALCGNSRRGAFDQLDFEELGPAFTGDEQAVLFSVVGDAVQNVGLVVAIRGGQQTVAIDPADHFAGRGVDAHDALAGTEAASSSMAANGGQTLRRMRRGQLLETPGTCLF